MLPLGNFAEISYLEEKFKPHLLKRCLHSVLWALVSDSLLHNFVTVTNYEKSKIQ